MLETTEQRTIEHPATGGEPTPNGNAKRRGIARAALLAVAVAVVAAVAFAVVSRPASAPVPEQDLTSGFEYTTEATSGRIATDRITTPYFGNSDELFPEQDLTSGFEYNTEATSREVVGGRITTPYFGNSPELNPDH